MNETDPTDRPFLEVPLSTVSPPFNLSPLHGLPSREPFLSALLLPGGSNPLHESNCFLAALFQGN